MTGLGIVQRGDPRLTSPAQKPFALPAEADEARRVVDRLSATADLVQQHYEFKLGMGVAAPQIGIARRAAIVALRAGDGPIVLLNARVTRRGPDDRTKRYEGCLSFFDVRGEVRRPRWIVVEHVTLSGSTMKTRFDDVAARLVMHEIDHLDGVLYDARLARGDRLMPVELVR